MIHALGAGVLFGIGLWLSGMANPRKVLDFLDVAGDWDPSLLLRFDPRTLRLRKRKTQIKVLRVVL